MDKLAFIQLVTRMDEKQYQILLSQLDLSKVLSSNTDVDLTPSKDTDWIYVNEYISVYRQKSKTKYWSARIKIDADGEVKEKRFSTKKEHVEDAKVFATEQRLKLMGKVESGYSLDLNSDLSFRVVANKAITEMQAVIDNPALKNTTYKDYISLLQNHIIDFFGDTNIKNVDYPMLMEYFEQTTVRSKSRIVMQKTCIRKVFAYAVKKRLVSAMLVPDMPTDIVIKDPDYNVQPFSEHDLQVLRDNYPSFIEASRTRQTRHYREAFQHYFSFLLSTGVRPGEEPKGIAFKDISKHLDKESGNHYYVIRLHKGKTQTSKNKYRDIAIDATAVLAIEHVSKTLMGLRTAERLDYLIKNYPDRFVFKSYVYDTYPAYERIFSRQQYLDYVSDKLHHDKYVTYSARHTYINNQLAANITHNDIAEHCGNSIQVIEAHYQKAKLLNKAPKHIAGNIVDYSTPTGLREGLDKLGFLEANPNYKL